MEFYAFANACLSEQELQQHLSISALPGLCQSISEVLNHEGDRGEIYCVWGQFRINREAIRDGIRFSLANCPNALAWTITRLHTDPERRLIVHLTINRSEHDADFITSMEDFVADWKTGLEMLYGNVPS